MALQKRLIEMIVGNVVSNSEAETEADKIGIGQSAPSTDPEVVGRCFKYEFVICPICSVVNYVYVDTEVYKWYQCWNTKDGRHYFRV